MTAPRRSLFHNAGRGAVLGLTAWSAYTATEFVFSSLLFSFTRPYAIFTPWHWELTWILLAAFLFIGILCGALAGVAYHFFGDARRPEQLQEAAVLTLVMAFLVTILPQQRTQDGWYLLVATLAAFVALSLLGLSSAAWHERLGYLTNAWVVSALLLGVGEEAVVVNSAAAEQLGHHVGPLEALLAFLLLVLAVAAVMAGRVLRRRIAGSPFARAAAYGFAPVAAILLVGASQMVFPGGTAKADTTTPVIAPTAKPNVLLVVMDTVRADHLNINGYPEKTTPHLRELAKDSVLYREAMAASNFTLTSHASLFTGVYPSWHGAYCQPPDATYGRKLDGSVPTLAGLLTRNGYTTVGVAANLYMRSEFALDRGFENFEIPRPIPVLTAENWYMLRRPVRRLISFGFDTSQFDRLYSLSEAIDNRLFSLLDHRSSGKPFFAFLNYMDAHFPYVPPAPYDRLFPGKNARLTEDDLDLEQQRIAQGGPVPANYRPETISQYDGGIAYMDEQIGRLVQWLKASGAYDNTMIVVTSDHGESFGERNYTGHANSAYQNLLHVALLVKYPHAAHTGVVDAPVSLVDVAPTILNQVGEHVPANMQGRNLLQAADGPPRELFSETFPCAVVQAPECPRGCIARAVYSWPYKFITSTNGRRQLYDLRSDPDETHDLSMSMAPLAHQLNADLNTWMKTFPTHSRQNLQLDPEMLRRLKSLGYVQ